MSYGTIFDAWRKNAGRVWSAYVKHAFVKGLGDGSLPRQTFLNYLRQDYIFLLHFTRAWSLAVIKAETLDEMRLAANTATALINEEISLHIKTCAEAGISETELFATEELTENLAYTRYVLDAGYTGDLLDLLATLAPCVMGYGEIGKLLSCSKTSDQYSDWIETYASHDYQQVCHDVGQLIDCAVERRLGSDPPGSPRWLGLCHRFTTATRLEVGFWEMGYSK